jgi:tRNA dimethylallyltransferase
VPILVGGTGLYLRTLLDGIAPVPAITPTVRAEVRALPTSEAYAALQREDPHRAAALAPGDSTRVARALEVVRSTGKPLAEWQGETTGGIGAAVTLHPAVLLPAREWVYARCDARFAQMLDGGAIAEVEALLARKLDPDLPVMRAIGVAEIGALLAGALSREEAESKGAQATRNYAKRQFTWLRNQSPIDWLRIEAQSFDPEAIFVSLLRY